MTKAQIVSTYKTCECCGRPLPEQKKTGRPRVFCSDDCRRLIQLLGWTEDLLAGLDPTDEKKKLLRRRIWSAANLLNAKH